MRLLLTLLIVAALVSLPGPAAATDLEELKMQHLQYQGEADLQVAQSGCTSLSQAIESVRRSTGGTVVSAVTKVQGGREVHHIKVLTKDGKVKTHKVNGRRL
jgi:uncharacterized membrane protein YkoI